MSNLMEQEIDGIVSSIIQDYTGERSIDKVDLFHQPDHPVIISLVDKLFQIAYLGYYRDQQESFKIYNMNSKLTLLIEDVAYQLNKQLVLALHFAPEYAATSDEIIEEKATEICVAFLKKIPKIREYLETDLQAAFDGDPATGYKEDIILSYPGFYAITVNRMAHELFLLGVPLIPRIMTEYAHSKTGIDIHPGATIGKYFFIDHGTGVVIGETTTIGDYVKIYQGVTLGALSTRGGQLLRGTKRHPTIEDNVTIYSGASILGGETVIGRDSVIGSNAFITRSIAPGTRVSIKNQELILKSGHKEMLKEQTLGQDDSWFYVI
jgi:serine O-acetyltransferase